MESSVSNLDEPFPTPPPYFLSDEYRRGQEVGIYQIHSPLSPPPALPSISFSPGVACSTQSHCPASAFPPSSPRPKFVSYETELYRSPALTTCPSCQAQVTTQVTYHVGKHAWLMCVVFVLCGLVFCCCLIPFFVNHFKDARHTCPRCRGVLHIHRKTCCD